MLKKILSTVGIGSATVNTRLAPGAEFLPGGEMEGDVLVQGGSVPQEIRGITLRLMTQYEVEVDDSRHQTDFELTAFRIPEAFTVQPGEERIFDFTLVLPLFTPMTTRRQRVWLKTELDIASGIDSSDSDPVTVAAPPIVQAVIGGMVHLGFSLRDSRCEKGKGVHVPFVQEFEFVAKEGFYRGRVDEVDVVFRHHGDSVEVLLEVDRKARGLGGLLESALDMDERRVRLQFGVDDAGKGPQHFADWLHRAMSVHAS